MELVGVYGFRQAYAGMAVNAEMIGKAKYGMSGLKEANVRGDDGASKASLTMKRSRGVKQPMIYALPLERGMQLTFVGFPHRMQFCIVRQYAKAQVQKPQTGVRRWRFKSKPRNKPRQGNETPSNSGHKQS